MAHQPVKAATLGQLADGAGAVIIDAAIRAAVGDLKDRGHQDGKPRVVNVKLEFDYLDKDKNLPRVKVNATATLPPYKTGSTMGTFIEDADGNVCLTFEEHNADNPEQPTIYDHPKIAAGE